MIDTQINKIQNENIDHSPEAKKSQSTPQIYYCLTWKEQKRLCKYIWHNNL